MPLGVPREVSKQSDGALTRKNRVSALLVNPRLSVPTMRGDDAETLLFLVNARSNCSETSHRASNSTNNARAMLYRSEIDGGGA